MAHHGEVFDESTHRIRHAWVRLGTYFRGAMDGDAIEVRWGGDG